MYSVPLLYESMKVYLIEQSRIYSVRRTRGYVLIHTRRIETKKKRRAQRRLIICAILHSIMLKKGAHKMSSSDSTMLPESICLT